MVKEDTLKTEVRVEVNTEEISKKREQKDLMKDRLKAPARGAMVSKGTTTTRIKI